MTKDAIIQMVKAGLPEDVIVSKIRGEANPPQISTEDLISLKSAGVPDGIIRALVAPVAKVDPPAVPGTADASTMNKNDPMATHDPGIYMMSRSRDGSKTMVLIERAGAGREKTANVWGAVLTEGISKAKIKAEIPGPRAAVRAFEEKPEFYMYFPPTGNLGAADTISSPSQFSLLRLEDKKDHRETTVAKRGFASASAGNDNKRTVTFNAEKIRPYAYKVTPNSTLKAGEYAFVAATGMGGSASASAVVVFDFGVDLQ